MLVLKAPPTSIVLDDVSSRYMKAASLQACDVHLDTALRSLIDCGEGEPTAASLPTFSVTEA